MSLIKQSNTKNPLTIAIIPARGGSKRIPRKNIELFIGKPIIAYTIETALASMLFDEVMVSTDDREIKEVALKYGAKVPFIRSAGNADDHATTASVLLEVIHEYESRHNSFFTYGCCIYPAAPQIQTEHLVKGLSLLKAHGADSVFPVVPFSYPVWRGLRREEDGRTSMVWPEYLRSRSQDLEPVYHDAGQWYWFDIGKFKISKELYSQNSASIVLNEMEAQDIDSPDDWKLAEMKYRMINNLL